MKTLSQNDTVQIKTAMLVQNIITRYNKKIIKTVSKKFLVSASKLSMQSYYKQ